MLKHTKTPNTKFLSGLRAVELTVYVKEVKVSAPFMNLKIPIQKKQMDRTKRECQNANECNVKERK